MSERSGIEQRVGRKGAGSQRAVQQCSAWPAVAALVLSLAHGASAQAQCRYEVTAIIQGPSCGIFGHANVELKGLNDLGQACGVVFGCAGSDVELPWVWSKETGLVLLELPEGATRGEAVDINNVLGNDGLGQVACTLEGPSLGQRAFLYDDGEWTNLGVLPGHHASEAHSINDKSNVVGRSQNILRGPRRGFMWTGAKLVDLPLSVGPNSEAFDVNDASNVSGWMGQASTSISSGFIWESELAIELPPPPGTDSSSANAISNSGLVIGQAGTNLKSGPDAIGAWRYQGGKLEPLPRIELFDRVQALDVNDADQILVVAHPFNSGQPGNVFLWQKERLDSIFDLVIDVDGVNIGTSIAALNNLGQIGGTAGFPKIGSAVAVILTPVDVPFGDVTFDCVVDQHDLIAVLTDWGHCSEVGSCLCDIVTNSTLQPPADGVVDGADLAVVLGNWSASSSRPLSKRNE